MCPDLHSGHRLLRDVGSPGGSSGALKQVCGRGHRTPWRSSRGPGEQGLHWAPSPWRAGSSTWAEAGQQPHHRQPRLIPLLAQAAGSNGVNQKRRVASTSSRRHPGMFQRCRGFGSSASPEPGLYFRAVPWAALTVASASGLPLSTEPCVPMFPLPAAQGWRGAFLGPVSFQIFLGSIRAERMGILGSVYPNLSASS